MSIWRPGLAVSLLVVSTSLAAASAAEAIPCGDMKRNGVPARATLTLLDSSTVSLPFGRDTDEGSLELIFRATGCDLGTRQPEPEVRLRQKPNSVRPPMAAFEQPVPEPDGTEYTLQMPVNAEAFEPDSYGALVQIRAPYLVTSRTPIEVSRSEPNEFKPIGLGALGGAAAFVWFFAVKVAGRNKLAIGKGWAFLFLLAAAIGGGVAGYFAYEDQDIWSVEENWLAAVAAGFAGGSTGSMATTWAALFIAPAPTQPGT